MKNGRTRYETVQVSGLEIFYREAGPADAPTILMLHGYPSSSHMFRDLIPLLSDQFRLVAPDYPGFGFSSSPTVEGFEYTFERLTDVVDAFTDVLGLQRYALYMQDFGGPVGFRLAVRHPEKVSALIIQNANAYDEGMSPTMRSLVLPLWPRATPDTIAKARPIFELPNTKRQFLAGVPDLALVNPDCWHHAQCGLDRPGMKEVALALHENYGSNLEKYAEWQSYFRQYQPPALIAWGKGDFIFTVAGADAYRKDLIDVEQHILDTGHFALETHAFEIAALIRRFFSEHVSKWTQACIGDIQPA
jgi:pimeloyl-ACP methyl ester carboxylesterase